MKKIKVILSFIIVLLILTVPISETSVFAAAPPLGSAASINVINHSKINFSLQQPYEYNLPTGAFYANRISSAHLTYSPLAHNLSSCESKSNISNNSYSSSSSLTTFPRNGWIFNYYHTGSTKTCNDTQINIPGHDFHNTGNFGTVFQFVNASEIEATDQKHIFNLTPSSNGILTYSYSHKGCTSTITTQADNTSNATIPITSGSMIIKAPTPGRFIGRFSLAHFVDTPFPWPKPFPTNSSSVWENGGRCSSFKLNNINLDDPTVNGQLASDIAGPGISNQSTSSTSTGLSCGFNFNPLNFVFCGLIKLGLAVVSGINSIIYSQLNLGTCSSGGGASSAPNQIFGNCGGTNGSPISSAYHTAWDQFRNIALALLVIMTLIIIIAQAIKG